MVKRLFFLVCLLLVPAVASAFVVRGAYDGGGGGSFEILDTAVITWASGATPAAQNVTVPVGTDAAYVFWSYYAGGDSGLSAMTLGGESPDQTRETPAAFDQPAIGVAAFYSPSSGSLALDVDWDASPAEGPTTFVVFVDGANTSSWRDVDSSQTISGPMSVTIDSSSSDIVLKLDRRYGGTLPGTSTGWTSLETLINNNGSGRLSQANSPGAATTACDSENEDYSGIVCVSISEAP